MNKNSESEQLVTPDHVKGHTDRADFHKLPHELQEQVRAKQISMNAAAIQAGIRKKPTPEEQWTELGKELARNSKNLMWMIGDWLIAGSHPDRKYLPEGKLDEACALFGIEYQTAKNAKCVCLSIPQRYRREYLSFKHHAEVAGREDKVGEVVAIHWVKLNICFG